MSESKTYYRYTVSGAFMRLEEFEVIKHTECGVWIRIWGEDKKYILNRARKKWANPTKEEALEAYYARKRKQIEILEHQLAVAKEQLEYAPDKDNMAIGSLKW